MKSRYEGLSLKNLVLIAFWFILIFFVSGILHEFGHCSIYLTFYSKCEMIFSFQDCGLFPICLKVPKSITLFVYGLGGVFGGVFAGFVLSIFYLIYQRWFERVSFISLMIGIVYLGFIFVHIFQGLVEGFLPSLYSVEFNSIFAPLMFAVGVVLYLWYRRKDYTRIKYKIIKANKNR